MGSWTTKLGAMLLVVGTWTTHARADDRIALVIGNGAYQHIGPLNNATGDAELIAEALKRLGFELVGNAAQVDVDRANIERLILDFGAKLQSSKVALFYFAGHGIQAHGSNYLVPTDANPTKEADLDFQTIPLDSVMRQMGDRPKHLNIVILDACRNNPFPTILRGAQGGLARTSAPRGTLISYATQPGGVADDGAGNHSPYSLSLSQILPRPGLGLFETFNEVGLAVERATNGQQIPWESHSPITENFYFAGPPNAGPNVGAVPASVAALEELQEKTKEAQTRLEALQKQQIALKQAEDEIVFQQNKTKANSRLQSATLNQSLLQQSFRDLGFNILPNANLTGGTILGSAELTQPVPNAYACARRCKAVPACSGFSFQSARAAGTAHSCYLFGGNPESIPAEGWTSGQRLRGAMR